MTVLLPWFALVVTVLAGWAIIKRLSTSMVLLFAGLAMRECLKFCVCPKFITYVALRRGGSLVERSGTSEPPLRRFRSSHHSILA